MGCSSSKVGDTLKDAAIKVGTQMLASMGSSSGNAAGLSATGGETTTSNGVVIKNLATSVMSKVQSRDPAVQTTEYMMQQDIQLTARCGSGASPAEDSFFGPAQFLICSPAGHQVTVTAQVVSVSGAGGLAASNAQVELYFFQPNGFPLSSATLQAQDKASGIGRVSAQVTLPGVNGVVVCVGCPGGVVDVSLHGESGPILTVTHPEPLQ